MRTDKEFGKLSSFIRDGNSEALRKALDAGVSPDLKNRKGTTLLMVAAEQLNESAIQILRQHGANPKLKDKKGYTAASVAAFVCELRMGLTSEDAQRIIQLLS